MDATKVTVLGVSRYSFEDEKTNRLVEGTKVIYFPHDVESQEDRVGYQIASAKLPYADFHKFVGKTFPYVADIDYSISIKGKEATFKIKEFIDAK